jgi:hypothetical protein
MYKLDLYGLPAVRWRGPATVAAHRSRQPTAGKGAGRPPLAPLYIHIYVRAGAGLGVRAGGVSRQVICRCSAALYIYIYMYGLEYNKKYGPVA